MSNYIFAMSPQLILSESDVLFNQLIDNDASNKDVILVNDGVFILRAMDFRWVKI